MFDRFVATAESVDTKNRELVGNFKNVGACWRQSSRLVYDHDFRSESIGGAIPYRIYDTVANRGSVALSGWFPFLV